MSKDGAVRLLAMMEAIAGRTIPQKRRKPTLPERIRIGSLNKICLSCGHKNKKCTCELEQAIQEASDE